MSDNNELAFEEQNTKAAVTEEKEAEENGENLDETIDEQHIIRVSADGEGENNKLPDAPKKSKQEKKEEKRKIKEHKKELKERKKKSPITTEEKGTAKILVAIMIVGVCLFGVSIGGIKMSVDKLNKAQSGQQLQQTPQQNDIQQNNGVNTPVQTPDVNSSDGNNSVQTPGEQSGDNQLQQTPQQGADSNAQAGNTDYKNPENFNAALNKLKTEGPSFTKAKQTKIADIQLSNSLAQAYVSTAKEKYLSDETVKTEVAKGDKAAAVNAVSPDGAAFVSSLTAGDIKNITDTVDANGNHVVKVEMNDLVNPDSNSAYAKIFEFMYVDDVMTTYAPNMGATVDRENVSLQYHDCYAQATISPEGKILEYSTRVKANMVLKDAKVKIVTTDLDVVIESNTSYTNIVW